MMHYSMDLVEGLPAAADRTAGAANKIRLGPSGCGYRTASRVLLSR
jgi:hypothetical protein